MPPGDLLHHRRDRDRAETKMQRRHLPLLGMIAPLLVATAGCPIPPSDACEKYVACQEHYDSVNDLQSDDLDEIYGEEGRCWRDEQSATSCTSSCELATERLAEGLAASGDDPGPCD